MSQAMNQDPLFRKTLMTVAVMAGSVTLFLGAASLLAMTVTARAVGGERGVDTPLVEQPAKRPGLAPVPTGRPAGASASKTEKGV